MGKIVLYTGFLDFDIIDKSSEQTNYLADNISNPDKQFKYWKTTDTSNSYVTLDLGGAKSLSSIAIINPNYTSFSVEGSTSTSFSSPDVNSGTLTITKDTGRGRYYGHTNPQNYSPAFNYQYVKIKIPTQATTDGLDYFRTGGIVLKDGTTELLVNPQVGMEYTIFRSADRVDLRSGIPEVRNVGERLVQITMTMYRDIRIEANYDEMAETIMNIDESEPVLLFDNANFLSKPTNSPFIYVLRRVGAPSFSLPSYPMGELSNITLIEQV